MKTAISLPDPVFAAAERLAQRFQVSRSELYVMALERFIREHQDAATTQQVDAFLAEHGQPVDPAFASTGLAEMRREPW